MRDRKEPLVADERIGPVRVRLGDRLRWRRSDPPCFSVIAMPTVAGLLRSGNLARIIFRRADQAAPFSPAGRIAAQDWNGGIGHAERTADTVFALVPEVGDGRARRLRSGPRLRPGS